MGIRLFHLMGETPDRVKSSPSGGKRHVWCLRDKEKKGLNVRLEYLYDSKKSKNKWIVKIYDVKWNGEEFVEDEEPKIVNTYENAQDAISYAEESLKSLCENNKDLSHCLKFFNS